MWVGLDMRSRGGLTHPAQEVQALQAEGLAQGTALLLPPLRPAPVSQDPRSPPDSLSADTVLGQPGSQSREETRALWEAGALPCPPAGCSATLWGGFTFQVWKVKKC